MPLPEPLLDDMRFQRDLVDEARRRIIHYCPEWTDYNLSDPGITLIELFAWMTENILYRLNRVPEKNYLKFMELLGIQLKPASSARAGLTFWLSTPFPISPGDPTQAVVPKGTEVATRRTEEEPEISFTTDERLVIAPPLLTQLRRDEDPHKNYAPRLGVETFYAFGQQRLQVGNTFYLGFSEAYDLSGHILQLSFQCEPTQATGIRREDPPLVWECLLGSGQWQEVPVSSRPGEKDTTGGLNNPQGSLVLYLPLALRPGLVNGRSAFWLRCRFEPRRPEQGRYTESPRILNLTPYTLGASTRATHALIVENELLGRSNGDPGQVFRLANRPVLELQDGEELVVEGESYARTDFVPWKAVDTFAYSTRYDRHFMLDTAGGEISFGPAVRQPDGSVRVYGRVPEAGREIRFTRYRYGGGVQGNLPEGKLEVLKTSLAYIDRVTNLSRAEGGRDQESLEEAKLRARRELHTQQRAVTAEDYEVLTSGASRAIARVKCQAPGENGRGPAPGTIELLVVPAAYDGLAAGDLSRLQVDEPLKKTILAHLEKYRLLTTALSIREPNYIGVRVTAEIVVAEWSQPEVVVERVQRLLRSFLSPLPPAAPAPGEEDPLPPDWRHAGWDFGRDLYLSEIDYLIRKVPGVKYVWELSIQERPVIPHQEAGPPLVEPRSENAANFAGARQTGAEPPTPLQPVEQRRLHLPADTLLCSLDHDIRVVEE